PHHRAVAAYPPDAQHGGSHRGHAGFETVQVIQDRRRVLADQVLLVRAQQHGYAAIGQRSNCHHATAGTDTITCALVPLMPNADTAPIRCPSTAGHGVSVRAKRNPWLSQSISRLGSSTCRVGGTAPCSAETNTLARPRPPAAACAWPTLDFTDPSRAPFPGPVSPYVCDSDCNSMRSPIRVPVP